MEYAVLLCRRTECPHHRNGFCKFDAFSEIPCEDMTGEEFNAMIENFGGEN